MRDCRDALDLALAKPVFPLEIRFLRIGKMTGERTDEYADKARHAGDQRGENLRPCCALLWRFRKRRFAHRFVLRDQSVFGAG